MAALDACEPQMVRALEKDGWKIARKPYTIKTKLRSVFADFSLRRDRDGVRETIVIIEVKCFTHEENDLDELYIAIGQCLVYQTALAQRRMGDKQYPLYLALPEPAYQRFAKDPVLIDAMLATGVKLVVIDVVQEVVVKWNP